MKKLYYSIGEVSKIMDIPASTIRFYDKQGLLPFLNRDENGYRKFKDNDFNFLKMINCLKKSGVPIDDIGRFINLAMRGDTTLQMRYEFLNSKEKEIEIKVKEIQEQLDYLRFKKWYYKTAIEAGTESIHFIDGTNFLQLDIHEKYLNKLATAININDLINF